MVPNPLENYEARLDLRSLWSLSRLAQAFRVAHREAFKMFSLSIFAASTLSDEASRLPLRQAAAVRADHHQ